MAAITADMIKELRERTGVGMSKCKEALDHAKGDMESAIDYLRKTGAASAVKKADRESNEGKILSAETNDTVAIVEVSAETDFVANNERFLDFATEVAKAAAESKTASVEELMKKPYAKDPRMTLEEYRGTVVQAIGENIQVKRIQLFTKSPTKSVGVYSHMGGKIVTVVVLDGASDQQELAKEVAMHAAAASPDFLAPEKVPAEVISREKEIARAQLESSGKPANMFDKIIEGKLKAYYDSACLVCQKYIRDDSLSVQQYVEKKGKGLKVSDFLRWTVGVK